MLIALMISCLASKNLSPTSLLGLNPENKVYESMCVRALQLYIEKQGCKTLIIKENSKTDMYIRCNIPDEKRTNPWNSNFFRIVRSNNTINEEDFARVKNNTICEDEHWRVESYLSIDD